MTKFSFPISSKLQHGLTLAVGIAGLALIGGPAAASTTVESVHVISPRPPTIYDEFGTPILEVSLSRPVSYSSLNLRTHQGAQTLRFRIRNTARDLCARLNFQYPVTTSGNPPCYRTTVKDAMRSANRAIREARYDSTLHEVHID
jgi:UrcA family protein